MTCLQHTPVCTAGCTPASRWAQASHRHCGSWALCCWAWLGTKQAAFLVLAVHAPPHTCMLYPWDIPLWDTLLLLQKTHFNAKLYQKQAASLFWLFQHWSEVQTNLGEYSPGKQQAWNARGRFNKDIGFKSCFYKKTDCRRLGCLMPTESKQHVNQLP